MTKITSIFSAKKNIFLWIVRIGSE